MKSNFSFNEKKKINFRFCAIKSENCDTNTNALGEKGKKINNRKKSS